MQPIRFWLTRDTDGTIGLFYSEVNTPEQQPDGAWMIWGDGMLISECRNDHVADGIGLKRGTFIELSKVPTG